MRKIYKEILITTAYTVKVALLLSGMAIGIAVITFLLIGMFAILRNYFSSDSNLLMKLAIFIPTSILGICLSTLFGAVWSNYVDAKINKK